MRARTHLETCWQFLTWESRISWILMILFVLSEFEIFKILMFQIIWNLAILSIWVDSKIWTKAGSWNFEFKKFPQSLQIFNLTSFKVNIAQTNIGYIPPLPKSIMALNISFNPIYDFDQGLDLTNYIHRKQPEGNRSTHSVIEKKMHLWLNRWKIIILLFW